MSESSPFLAQSAVFRTFSAPEIELLERLLTILPYPAGRILYRPGETGSGLFILKTGRVQLYHLSTDGRKLITATINEGACFGEEALLEQHNQQQSFAEVMEDANIYLLARHDAEQLLQQKPGFALALLTIVNQRMRQLEGQLLDTTFKSSTARLATLLLELAQPSATGVSALEITGISHEELAEHLGVYRETISTALRDLKALGTIALKRKHILIQDPTQLAGIAAANGKGTIIQQELGNHDHRSNER